MLYIKHLLFGTIGILLLGAIAIFLIKCVINEKPFNIKAIILPLVFAFFFIGLVRIDLLYLLDFPTYVSGNYSSIENIKIQEVVEERGGKGNSFQYYTILLNNERFITNNKKGNPPIVDSYVSIKYLPHTKIVVILETGEIPTPPTYVPNKNINNNTGKSNTKLPMPKINVPKINLNNN